MKFFRPRRDDNDAAEIESHLSLLEEEHRSRGLSTQEARDAARRSFGSVLKARQMYREQRRWHWAAVLAYDATNALRHLVRSRGLAWTPIVVLGLGIGANHMIFTMGYSHTMRGLPIDRAERVLMASFAEGSAERQLSWPDVEELRSQASLLSGVGAIGATLPVSVSDSGRAPDRYQATYVTANAFDVIGVQPVVGRTFAREEEQPGAPRVALVGRGLWRARYASDTSIIGRDILINGQPTTVVGLIPERTGIPSTAEVWLPVAHAVGFAPEDRTVRTFRAFGRVADTVAVSEAQAQLETLLAASARQSTQGGRLQPSVSPISRRFFGTPTDGVWLAFFSAGFLVLIVSSANVANIMLGRGFQRSREIAIRGSLGASRARVFTQLLVESVAIASSAAAIGLLISVLGVRAFRAQIPADVLPYWLDYSLDASVFVGLVAMAFATVLIFGLLPALHASKVDVIKVLRDGGWGGSGRNVSRHWTTAFMVVQIGLACVLLAYGVTNSFDTEEPPRSDAVLNAPDVLTASIALSGERYRTPEQRAEFFRTIRERVAASPGVTAVSLTGVIPRAGALDQRLQRTPDTDAPIEQLPGIVTVSVGPGFFSTLRLTVMQGREFDDSDQPGEPTGLVNQRFVSTFLASESPLGRQITVVNPATKVSRTLRIVGVVEDVRHRGTVGPVVYLPLTVTPPSTAFLLVRNQLDAASMTTQLRSAVLSIDPNLPVFGAQTLARAVYDATWNPRVSVRLVNTLTFIVLVLVGVGLSATAAQAVLQRYKEIGIRVAVGAQPRQVAGLVLGRAVFQVALGVGFGLLCTMAWDAAFFSGSSAGQFARPSVPITIAAVLATIMAIACGVPVRRALRLDPIAALRQD